MINQQKNYSDIASIFKKNATNQNAVADNRNISSVLSQIQDDGPARIGSNVNSHADQYQQTEATSASTAASEKSDNLINLRSQTDAQLSDKKTNGMFNNETKAPYLSSALSIDKKKAAWLQILFITFFIVFIMFYLFRIDVRTNQLEISLSALDEEVLDTVDSYSSELSPKFRSLKKTLKEVRQDIELIKSSTVLEVKPDAMVALEATQQSSKINTMADEILALKSDLKTATEKLNEINASKKDNAHSAVNKQPTTKTKATVITTGWVANLASFTSENKANKALEPLLAAGLSPLIQRVNVNGKRIYRLIVDGFVSIDEANSFVHRAEYEFGLSGGWIRKT